MEHRHLIQPEPGSRPTMAMVDDWLVRGDLPEMQHLLRLMIADPVLKADVREKEIGDRCAELPCAKKDQPGLKRIGLSIVLD